MTSDFPGFSTPSAGFEAPLEMLAVCHRRIRTQCATLSRLRTHVAMFGADDAACTAVRHVMRYFDGAARHHYEDEEQGLFPALLESMAGSDAIYVRQLVDSLTIDHRELERLWDTLKAWLVRIEARDAASPEPGEISLLIDLYERRIAREEQELLPMAARLLGSTDLDRIGNAMRLRRGSRQPEPTHHDHARAHLSVGARRAVRHGSALATILRAATGLAVFIVFRISDRKESAFV